VNIDNLDKLLGEIPKSQNSLLESKKKIEGDRIKDRTLKNELRNVAERLLKT